MAANHPRRNMPISYNPSSGGRPRYASNHWLLPEGNPDKFSGGQLVTASDSTPRKRAEVICSDGHSVLCIRKPGYLLLPGGGVDPGEEPLCAVVREALEESGIKLKNIKFVDTVVTDIPEDHPIGKGASSIETTLFVAESAGDWGGSHPDLEEFAFLPYTDVMNHHMKCMADPEMDWADKLNRVKLQAFVDLLEGETKIAATPRIERLVQDIPKLKRKAFMFDLDGTLRTWKNESFNGDISDISILPHRIDFLKSLKAQGFTLVAVTNHSSYPGEDISEVALQEYQEHTNQLLGGLLDDIYWMTSYDESLAKPRPTMLNKAKEDWGVDTCPYIGDSEDDRKAAEAAGMPFIHVDDIFGKELETKVADVPVVMPKTEFMMFSRNGKLFVKPRGNRRFEFPTEGTGKHIPYTVPTRFLPSTGVPEPGVHGYEYSFKANDVDQGPEGFVEEDPEQVLKTMYGGMGLSENREYQPLDRARVNAILRAFKARKKVAPPAEVVQPIV